jgi:Zn-dependent protease
VFGLDPYTLLLRAPVVLFSLTIHEFMHGWTAWKCGDNTAKDAGRLTLNPLAHLDVLGTIMLFIGPVGWAKPVPVNFSNLEYETRRRDEVFISGAGIVSNLAIALVVVLLARLLVWQGIYPSTDETSSPHELSNILWGMMGWAVLLNLGLAIFNLLPLFPLDGSHIMKNLLPINAAIRFDNLRRYMPIVLLVLVLVNAYSFNFLTWPVLWLTHILAGQDVTYFFFSNMW